MRHKYYSGNLIKLKLHEQIFCISKTLSLSNETIAVGENCIVTKFELKNSNN